MPVGTGTALTLGSAALGAVSGGRDKTSAAQTRPYMPKEYEEGYKRLLEDAMITYETPFRPVESRRAALAPSEQFGGIFFNPEMADIQRQSDARFLADLTAPSPMGSASQADPAQADEMLARNYLTSLMAESLPGTKQSQLYKRQMDTANLGDMGEALREYKRVYGMSTPSYGNFNTFYMNRGQ